MTNTKLSGKVALITGATRNLGRAISVALGEDGADIVVHTRGGASEAEARETAVAVEKAGRRALVVNGDITKVAEVERLFTEAKAKFGRIDILVNNAGLVIKKPLVEITEDDYDRLFAINSKAAFFAMQQAAKHLENGGRVINIGTTLLAAVTSNYSAYAGSKAPLEDFSRALAWEIGKRNITVNTVAPGPLDTSFFKNSEPPQALDYVKTRSVLGRIGEIDDIVPAVRFLASDEARWITAQTIFVNGGYAAR
jgi:NAD(P)-dependent dehydrogenase (short-subunit alcohol dehydrogenase family)